ncbi:MAG TPA: UDP-N-acetylglucosamine 2-epimerase (non-hydrolyzing) [Gemmatimonadaceae bacterium]|nr:UDP-N-acetylglucosamine 2-epimerase (non-hydrolyzing) [Gemmatimonadaceae bacterium]
MRVLHVVGARPNFMKLAPCVRALAALPGVTQRIVHTGQHYDDAMSDSFFRDLEIPPPDVNLEVGSASHAVQTARIMERFEPVVLAERPDWVVVYGDVNSTAAAALVCAKLGIRLAHVEAGLRSNDRTMPEEINRLVTDRLADLLLTPSPDADENLQREGVDPARVVFVGNVMIDTLLHALPAARATGFREALGLAPESYALVTLHRPSNVDDPARLTRICEALGHIARRMPVVFPIHPRTRSRLTEGDLAALGAVKLLEPTPYHATLDLTQGARIVITDSGGLQEETTALGVPCLTLRDNTERPITVTEGTNRLVLDLSELERLALCAQRGSEARRPRGWDGRAGERVALALRDALDP